MLKIIRKIFLAVIVIILLLAPLSPFNLTWAYFVLGCGIFLTVLPALELREKVVVLTITLLGMAIIWRFNLPAIVLIEGVGYFLKFTGILVIMQLFGIPIQLGTYSADFEYLLFKSDKQEKHLFFLTTILTHFFASFLLFGSIPVIVSLLGKPLQNNVKNYERFISIAMSRGYALMTSWSPSAIVLLVILGVTGLEWNQVFWWGACLSIIGIATSVFLEDKLHLSSGVLRLNQRSVLTPTNAWLSVRDIALIVLGMITIIYLLEKTDLFSSVYCVMLAALIIFSIWMTKFLKSKELTKVLKSFWEEDLLKTANLSALFIAIGILAKAFESSGVIGYLLRYINIAQWGYCSLVILPLIIIFTSMVGLHPLVSVVLLGKVFLASQALISPVGIALALVLGAAVSFMTCPIEAIILVIAKFVGRRPQEVAWKWNGLYASLFFLEGVLFIFALQALIF